jgi:hypothetical protein
MKGCGAPRVRGSLLRAIRCRKTTDAGMGVALIAAKKRLVDDATVVHII